jgi:microcystin-dependent protein
MSTPYIGEIRLVGFNFAPQDWAFCQGQLLSISQNSALFTLLGTTYGGDGVQTFALPNLQGRAPIHMGIQGGNTVVQGAIGGSESVTLAATQIPSHTHGLQASNQGGDSNTPTGSYFGALQNRYTTTGNSSSAPLLFSVGASQPHENRMPYMAMNYIIALYGVFPSQS